MSLKIRTPDPLYVDFLKVKRKTQNGKKKRMKKVKKNDKVREHRTRERRDSDEPFKLGIVVCTFSEGFKLWH